MPVVLNIAIWFTKSHTIPHLFHTITELSMDWRVTEQVIDALGITNSESITAISDAISYLGISTTTLQTEHSRDGLLRITIPIILNDKHEKCHAEFEPKARTWHLSPDCSRHFTLRPKDKDSSSEDEQSQRRLSLEKQQSKNVEDDWTKALPQNKHIEFILEKDWASTKLGPIREWPVTLRLMTAKMLSDPRPACLYWGKDRIAIYNEPFVTIAFSRHPGMMGSTARDAMPATWPFLCKMFEDIEQTGLAFSCPEFEMMVHKESGFLEEAWYDGIWSPISGLHGTIEGFYNSGYEITAAKILDRRNNLGHLISSPPDLHEKTVWQHILKSCEPYDRDVSMLMLYSSHTNEDGRQCTYQIHLEGSLGVPEAHSAAPMALDLYQGAEGFFPEFRTSKVQGVPIVLDTSSGRFPELLHGMAWRGFGEAATITVVIPLFVTGLIAGFAVVGLNPRRPYDEEHKQFVQDLSRAFTTALSNGISRKQALAREAQLSKELTRREKFIRKLTQVATVGIYSTSVAGAITYANAKFHEMTDMLDGTEDAQNFLFKEVILLDDQPKAIRAFELCRLEKTTVSVDLRLKKRWTPHGSSVEKECWILNSITPSYEDGEVIGTLGCLTDISQEVWALELQKDLAKSAEEAKRQQERFIDVTSHEMRNPLSAVMQSADSIRVMLDQKKQKGLIVDADMVEALRESAQTILFCTAHQKRIIDDILTVSKLDSTLLTITPVLVEPAAIARNALSMFEGELSASDIEWKFTLDAGYDIARAHCDPTRLTQILINLITNAIKFTKTSKKRQIHLTVGASTVAPPSSMGGMKWFPKQARTLPEKVSQGYVYLTFQVADTGTGMAVDEMARLFNRFSQASPMTHVQYGGSGLGLYISRELTEMQGGMIGASSAPGEGSKFGLYIKAEMTTPSDLGVPHNHFDGRRPSADSSRRGSIEHTQRHVLLVEDNLINQKVLLKQLQRQGCIVHVANHGLEALDIIRRTRFWHENNGSGLDLTAILMDWEMPICDGLTATRRLRQLEEQGLITQHLFIIMATANARAEQVLMAMEAGADDLLAKPFTISQAIKKIDSA